MAEDRAVLPNLKWLTSEAVNQPSRAEAATAADQNLHRGNMRGPQQAWPALCKSQKCALSEI